MDLLILGSHLVITYTSAIFFQRIQQPDSVSFSVWRMYTLLVSVPTYIHSEPYVQEMAVGLFYVCVFGSGREQWSNARHGQEGWSTDWGCTYFLYCICWDVCDGYYFWLVLTKLKITHAKCISMWCMWHAILSCEIKTVNNLCGKLFQS